MIDSIDEAALERLREALSLVRARAWELGVRPERERKGEHARERTVIDIDATLTTAYSDKEQAAGNFKGGFGHHPLLCYEDGSGEALAGELRPGNAGSNTAADHIAVLDLALAARHSAGRRRGGERGQVKYHQAASAVARDWHGEIPRRDRARHDRARRPP